MKRNVILLAILLIFAALFSGCGNNQVVEQVNEETAAQEEDKQTMKTEKSPPVIDNLDSYPLPVLSGWIEQKYEVREYDEGMNWEAVYIFEGDEVEQAEMYKEIIEELGFETQTLLNTVFKIGTAEFAGKKFHGTFTFGVGDEYSEWGSGQAYVQITFTEK